MRKFKLKWIADDEVEITVLPMERDAVLPSLPTTDTPTPENLSAHSQERVAATRLQSFLKDGSGTWSASGCREFLQGEGFNVEGMNLARVRKYADVHHYQEGGRSLWFLAAPIRAAAVELKNFLKDGERLASECITHLRESGFNGDKKEQWFVLKHAGAAATERDGLSWWSLSDSVEMVESFDGFSFDDLEPFEETTWQ
jgi:hypothetical protein